MWIKLISTSIETAYCTTISPCRRILWAQPDIFTRTPWLALPEEILIFLATGKLLSSSILTFLASSNCVSWVSTAGAGFLLSDLYESLTKIFRIFFNCVLEAGSYFWKLRKLFFPLFLVAVYSEPPETANLVTCPSSLASTYITGNGCFPWCFIARRIVLNGFCSVPSPELSSPDFSDVYNSPET